MKVRTILIADDHGVVRRGMRALLETDGRWRVVAEAADGREAVAKALEFRPDLAILDISMPGLNGLDACRSITKSLPETRVLILTVHRSGDLIARTLTAGARGYVLKSDAERDLIAAVEALLHDNTFFTAAVSETLKETVNGPADYHPEVSLSMRETEIVRLVAEGKSNKEVAAILGISTRTAENHRAHIMRKLGLHSLSELIRYAIRNKMVEA